jgi:hypothetical protein
LVPEVKGLRDIHNNWSRLNQEMVDIPIDCPPSPSLSVLQRRGSRRAVRFSSLRKRLNEQDESDINTGDFNATKNSKCSEPSAPPRQNNFYELV